LEGKGRQGGKGLSLGRWLIVKRVIDHASQQNHLLVLPIVRRPQVLKTAHELSGHLSCRKVLATIRRHFTWPGIGKDCQRANKTGAIKAPMLERPILSETLESLAIDLVGPLPKAKGGFRYLLTAICMSTRWPDAIPLRNMTAQTVADGLIQIVSRTGLPRQILSDQGTQFTGNLMKELCVRLGIKQLHTCPYHPQCNGPVERLHGTLEAALTKAHEKGLDWARQVLLTLFPLRQMVNRDTLFSPPELVYGRNFRTPLDALYDGWRDEFKDGYNVTERVHQLCEAIEVNKDVARLPCKRLYKTDKSIMINIV